MQASWIRRASRIRLRGHCHIASWHWSNVRPNKYRRCLVDRRRQKCPLRGSRASASSTAWLPASSQCLSHFTRAGSSRCSIAGAADITIHPREGGTVIPARPNWRYLGGTAAWPHSGLILAARITLLHFSVSSTTSLPKAAGEPIKGMFPKLVSCAFRLESPRPSLISAFSLSMTSGGVSRHADAEPRAYLVPRHNFVHCW